MGKISVDFTCSFDKLDRFFKKHYFSKTSVDFAMCIFVVVFIGEMIIKINFDKIYFWVFFFCPFLCPYFWRNN